MSKRMTIVFHDEALYTALKVEAARRHQPVSDLVAEAVRAQLEQCEDMEWLSIIEAARSEWQEKGGRPWAKVEQELEGAVSRRARPPEAKGVQD